MEESTEEYFEDIKTKQVKPQGNGAHITITKDWLGEDVKVIRGDLDNGVILSSGRMTAADAQALIEQSDPDNWYAHDLEDTTWVYEEDVRFRLERADEPYGDVSLRWESTDVTNSLERLPKQETAPVYVISYYYNSTPVLQRQMICRETLSMPLYMPFPENIPDGELLEEFGWKLSQIMSGSKKLLTEYIEATDLILPAD